jgi:hypothetical protein
MIAAGVRVGANLFCTKENRKLRHIVNGGVYSQGLGPTLRSAWPG